MSVWTDQGSTFCAYNLICSHAYTLIGKINATLASGKSVRLYKVRNPWRMETWSDGSRMFNGTYNDNATIWTTDTNLVNQTKFVSKNDGVVWMNETEFLDAFAYMQISEYRSKWVFSWYSAESTTTAQTYTITLTAPT